MRVLIQWATATPGDWKEVDSVDYAKAPVADVPRGAEAVGDSPGWVHALNVQGVTFHGYDHYAVIPRADDGVDVIVWNDDPEDWLGDRHAAIWSFRPLAPDPKFGGALNTRQTLTVFVESPDRGRPWINVENCLGVRPFSEFAAPSPARTRHGIWVADAQNEKLNASRRETSWREWEGGADGN